METGNVDGQIKSIEGKLKNHDFIMWGVIAVIALGFISLLLTTLGLVNTYLRDNQDTYKEYRDDLQKQNDKTDELIQRLDALNAETQTEQ